MKTYVLNPNTTFPSVPRSAAPGKSQSRPPSPSQPPAPAPVAPPMVRPPVQPLPTATVDPSRPRLHLGLDVHLEFIMAVAQRDHASPQAPRRFTRDELVLQVKKWVAEGFQVFAVQESCGFGFTLHRALVAAGAQSFLITPIALNGQRKTDKLDARALCLRLVRWVDGNRDELAPIRIPTEDEQRRREGPRRRQFLHSQIRRLANHGHGQVAEFLHEKLPSHWWGARTWKKLAHLDPWLHEQLAGLREVILALEAQVRALEAECVARVQDQPRPKGLGEITLATLDGEVCDWHRFGNRKQIGSYTGCCPGEQSSGGQRRLGSIDRMGNGRMRAILVEAVCRFLLWQPHWHAAQKMKSRLRAGAALRKKTVIALARQLAIDLWRWRTGRATMEELGWIAA